MTSTHQVSLTLLGAITATMLAVTATVASFVVIPTPQARSAELITETEAITRPIAAAPVTTIPRVRVVDVAGTSSVYRWTTEVHILN